MPVSKHRRGSKARPKQPTQAPAEPRPPGMTLDELRQAIANPSRDFRAKAILAGVWWFQQLLRKVGDRWQGAKQTREDKRDAALLLCIAMDGEHGQNDDLAPLLANLLRPYCLAPGFVASWEQANNMAPGAAREAAVRILAQASPPAA
ncbi:MAG TPA: hypothetical protein VFG12_09245 [Rhodopila sp.]|nr:hypothetical protein [Rhodopila sp.]